jgi:hypothetical protein
MLDADLPVDPPVAFGSVQAYALASLRNYVQMAVFEGASDDQIFDVVCAGLDWARAETTPAPVVLEAAR